MPSAREVVDKAMTEAEWQAQIVTYARMKGWITYHTRNSKGSDPGFPDLVLVRGDTVMFLELKKMGKNPDEAQQLWIARLKTANRVLAAVVRPSDWDVLEEQLRSVP